MRAESLRPAAAPDRRSLTDTAAITGRFLANVETVIHGKHDEITLVLTALACQGHVLLEDVPGTAKTVLARAIARQRSTARRQARIQCTPDLQPTDVTGLAVFDQKEREFEFRPGPIFAHIVLVDEINRAMPKTQSALLEAMAERQVTVDGVTRHAAGAVPPARDREPDRARGHVPAARGAGRPLLPEGVARLSRHRERAPDHPRPAPPAPARTARAGRRDRRGPRAPGGRQGGLHRRADRSAGSSASSRRRASSTTVVIGASVRGSLALERAARAAALLAGREYVVPADVEALILPVLGHRLAFTPAFLAEARRIGTAAALDEFRARAARSSAAAAPRLARRGG